MTTTLPHFTVDDTVAVLRALDGVHDEDEGVDALEHALQTADRAVDAGGDAELVAAALLHDIGRAPGVVEYFPTMAHEHFGAAFCRAQGSARIACLVARHVPAQRYLMAVDERYADALSPASVRSLARQGGPVSAGEVWAADGTRRRRWDDEAKAPGASTRFLDHFGAVLRGVWARTGTDLSGAGRRASETRLRDGNR